MKFVVTRTSMWRNEKPCRKTKKRIIEGYVMWTIEINTLDELIKFMKENKYDLVIKDPLEEEIPYYEIEIYDDYRE